MMKIYQSILAGMVLLLIGCAKTSKEEEDRTKRLERMLAERKAKKGKIVREKPTEGGEIVGEKPIELVEVIQVTESSLSQDTFPSWSPYGKRIAYSSYQDGKQKIWVIDVDEEGRPVGEPRMITKEEGLDPSWSPDGRRLVFHSDRSGKNELFVVDVETEGEEIILYRGDRSYPPRNPSWAPKGEGRVAFVSQNNIALIRIGQEEITYLTRSLPAFNDFPCWSPDGKEILFSSDGDLKVVSAEGEELEELVSGSWNGHPSWSPDGKRIAFISNKEKMVKEVAVNYYDLWVMDLESGKKTPLTNDYYREGYPSWSPDGKRIAFQCNRKGNYNIFVISIE